MALREPSSRRLLFLHLYILAYQRRSHSGKAYIAVSHVQSAVRSASHCISKKAGIGQKNEAEICVLSDFFRAFGPVIPCVFLEIPGLSRN